MFSLVGDFTKKFISSTNEEETRIQKKMKCRAFATLLLFKHPETADLLTPYDHISNIAYEFRQSRQFDRAHRLEVLSDQLEFCETTNAILSILIRLKRDVNNNNNPANRFYRNEIDSHVLVAKGAPVYGDTATFQSKREYMIYPKDLFRFERSESNQSVEETIITQSKRYFLPKEELFRQIPGSGLNFISNSNSSASLWGANLTNESKLIIPSLNVMLTESGERHLRVPKYDDTKRKITNNEMSSKEDHLAYCSSSKVQGAANVWNEIWKIQAPKRRTWERLGNVNVPIQKQYLTESTEALHKVRILILENLRMVHPSIDICDVLLVKESELITDISYLMIGVASKSFKYDGKSFHMMNGIAIRGITPETLQVFTQEYVSIGTCFRKLEDFSVQKSENGGLIFGGFKLGVYNYLKVYRTTVMNIAFKKKTLMDLSQAFRPLCKQIHFLATLCKIGGVNYYSDAIPHGVQLLNHLFKRTLHVNTKDLYFILVSIIKCSAAPYFRFLERWIFEGICFDEYSEFGLKENSLALSYRDRNYWVQGYVVETLPQDSSGEVNFIRDVQNQVYLCGKSLNLLKLCVPQHYLCGTSGQNHPVIRLLVNPSEETKLRREVKTYADLMKAIADEKCVSLKKRKEMEKQEKMAVIKLARQRHMQIVSRIREEVRTTKEKEERKKRQIFQDLKEQAIQDMKRKAELKLQEARENKEWIEKAVRKEKEEIEREERVKREIEEYYQSLTEAAERRERKAEWRLCRNNLRSKRIKFWREENVKIQNFLKNQVNERLSMTKVAPRPQKSKTWKSIIMKKDEQNNIYINLEDQESNIIECDVTNWSTFNEEIKNKILSQRFRTLPEWVQSKLLKNYNPFTTATTEPPLKSKPSPTPKRKRPDSFYDEETIETIYDSYDSSDTLPKNLNEITMIDGRKRPISKPIEDILYWQSDKSTSMMPKRTETKFEIINSTTSVTEYTKNFFDLISSSGNFFSSKHTSSDPPIRRSHEHQFESFTPLTILMENSILIPLRAQVSLVNQAILNYLLVDTRLMDHFSACRNYLLFYDGEFGHNLSYSLFDEIAECKNPSDILNPSTLNRLVRNATSSSTVHSQESSNVGFCLSFYSDSSDILSSLELTYRTEWPYNIILTPDSLKKYGQVFKFLIQLKKAVWALDQVFYQLKKTSKDCRGSHQFHRLHLMRNEMLNFVAVAQGYVSTQVLDVTWAEFQEDLHEKVKSVDDIYEAHEKYLNKALFRCLLNNKVKPVHKIITDILNIIVKFSLTLTKLSWTTDLGTVIHPSFQQLQEFYDQFKEYSSFLYQVVSKLSARGYQHHLHDLMLRLNFNEFYQKSI